MYLKTQQKLDVHVTEFCQYTLRQFISYNYYQLCFKANSKDMFFELFLNRNPLVKETEEVLLFIL